MTLAHELNALDLFLVFFLILLIPFASVGVALMSCGFGRSRSAAHMLLSSLCVFSVAAVVSVVWGFSLAKPWIGVAGVPSLWWQWPQVDTPMLVALLQIFSVGLAGLIPLSAGADRWRLGAICASTVFLAGITFPVFAHWEWGGGWLNGLGRIGLGRGFLDAAGAASIQAVGGLTALSIAWILGPRRGKYPPDGVPSAIPAHNVVFILLGCFLAWIGWIGLNSAGSVLLAGADVLRIPAIALNTTLSAAAAGLGAVLVTRLRFGKPDASLTANGWMAGLVASSAGAPWLNLAAALLVGVVAGVLVPLSVEVFESWLAVDDPGGAISVHGIGGMWGLLSLALFATRPGQWLAQVVGVATLLGFVLPLSYVLNWTLNRIVPQRVAPDGERLGMDLFELGAGAYPEIVSHSDEFMQR